jgi:PTH1 family peptidyl-tRNA hydrolase
MPPSPSHLVVGLGNPGPEYENTRHNVGFRVIDALADRLRISSFDRAHRSLVGWGQHKNRRLGLAKPLTFMNRSGESVAPLCEHYNVSPSDLIIVVDDLNLSVGTMRLRPNGSSGGHNGLENVAQHLGTTNFPRLRIGIGDDFGSGEQVDYVLSPFTPEQETKANEAIEDAVEAVLTTVREDLDTAMNRFN